MPLRSAQLILLLSFLFPLPLAALALSPDVGLTALVPPDSQIIAGMLTRSSAAQPGSLLLVTRTNGIDLQDFYAITGVDTSRSIRQVIFLAANGGDGLLSEHSLLAEGHFSRDAIFRFAVADKARIESYRGLEVLVTSAFAREQSTFDEVRWLAILDSKIAIFGSIASVQQELDRYLEESPTDLLLGERLASLGPEVQAWCLFPAPSPNSPIPGILSKLDPKLGAIAGAGRSMQYGIHFGRSVEITVSSNGAGQPIESERNDTSAEPSIVAPHLLRASSDARAEKRECAVVKVPLRRYAAWFAEYSYASLKVANAPSR